jgi:hypothetical protein
VGSESVKNYKSPKRAGKNIPASDHLFRETGINLLLATVLLSGERSSNHIRSVNPDLSCWSARKIENHSAETRAIKPPILATENPRTEAALWRRSESFGTVLTERRVKYVGRTRTLCIVVGLTGIQQCELQISRTTIGKYIAKYFGLRVKLIN